MTRTKREGEWTQLLSRYYVNCPIAEHGKGLIRNFHSVIEAETPRDATQKAVFTPVYDSLPIIAMVISYDLKEWKTKDILIYFRAQYKSLGKNRFYRDEMKLGEKVTKKIFNTELIGQEREDRPPQKPFWLNKLANFLPLS